MSADPDRVENRAELAVADIGDSIANLAGSMFVDGVRNGLETASRFVGEVAGWARADYTLDSLTRDAIVVICERLQEQFQLSAHSVPELPPRPTAAGQ
ncbi:hypothetical protein [Mycobacterium sp. SMC-11]|uniref:hypothetical protein n=1 Tax=Mycobacterium sp. SMC-11 TaxID=3385969 RepID=UPI00390CA6F0